MSNLDPPPVPSTKEDTPPTTPLHSKLVSYTSLDELVLDDNSHTDMSSFEIAMPLHCRDSTIEFALAIRFLLWNVLWKRWHGRELFVTLKKKSAILTRIVSFWITIKTWSMPLYVYSCSRSIWLFTSLTRTRLKICPCVVYRYTTRKSERGSIRSNKRACIWEERVLVTYVWI